MALRAAESLRVQVPHVTGQCFRASGSVTHKGSIPVLGALTQEAKTSEQVMSSSSESQKGLVSSKQFRGVPHVTGQAARASGNLLQRSTQMPGFAPSLSRTQAQDFLLFLEAAACRSALRFRLSLRAQRRQA